MAFPPFCTMDSSRFGANPNPPNNPYRTINLMDASSVLFPVQQPLTSLFGQVLFPTTPLFHPPPASSALVTELGPIIQNYDRIGSMNKREAFFVFTKFLLRVLSTDGNEDADSRLLVRLRVKAIIRDCVRQNRCGNLMYDPLIDAIKSRLKPIVGEDDWNKARRMSRRYLKQKFNYLRGQQDTKRSTSGFTAV